MTFGLPAGLWWLSVGAAVIALYLLRRKRQVAVVPSLEIWADLLGPSTRIRFARRLSRLLSLLIQLLLLALIVFALADPIIPGHTEPGRSFIILVDSSPSMSVERRLTLAKKKVGELLDRLGPRDRAVVYRAAAGAEFVCRQEPGGANARDAVAAIELSGQYADLAHSVRTLHRLADELENPQLFLISDGAEPSVADALEETGTNFLPVGSEKRYEISVEAVTPESKATPLIVRIVSAKAVPEPLLRALGAMPDYLEVDRIKIISPEHPLTTPEAGTVTIYYETAPATRPTEGNYLFFNPPPGGALPYEIGSPVGESVVWDWDRSSALTRHVDFGLLGNVAGGVPIRQADAAVIVSSSAGPVIAADLRGKLRYLHIGLSLERSNLRYLVAFPLFIRNAMAQFYALENPIQQPAEPVDRRESSPPLSGPAASLPAPGVPTSDPTSNLWAALAVGALLLGLLEWLLYHRRLTE